MCTVGVVRNKDGQILLFKNMDQVGISDYPEPEITTGGEHAYLGFGTKLSGPCGIWAGINERNLALVGADGNAIINRQGRDFGSLNLSLYAYRDVLAHCADIYSGIKFLMRYYQDKRIGGDGDIIMLADRTDAVALEYCYPNWGIEFLGARSYLVRTNFFKIMTHLRPPIEDNSINYSSALRYGKTFERLSIKGSNTDIDDILNLLRDHSHGPSAMSICRHGGAGEYLTRCATVFSLEQVATRVYYVVNGYPCEKLFTQVLPDWRKARLVQESCAC
ncbi:hypothetical protein JW905_17355 [bacterium]|nr:hypothetical protein [candidate division CSSED10-310 bacterium]